MDTLKTEILKLVDIEVYLKLKEYYDEYFGRHKYMNLFVLTYNFNDKINIGVQWNVVDEVNDIDVSVCLYSSNVENFDSSMLSNIIKVVEIVNDYIYDNTEI
jgi:hypothetical protein